MKTNELKLEDSPESNNEIVIGDISFKLWLEFEHWTEIEDTTNDFFNMKIILNDGRSYSLNVWTFEYLRSAQNEDKIEGEDGLGEYLIPPDLFVEKLDRSLIEKCVTNLIKNNELKEEWLDGVDDDIIDDFDLLVEIAYDLSQQFEGVTTKDKRKVYATHLLAKSVHSCFALLKFFPESKFNKFSDPFIDFSSVASLSRNLIELTNIHWYLTVDNCTTQEQELRLSVFDYHDSFSMKFITERLNFNETDINILNNRIKSIKDVIEKNSHFQSLSKNVKKMILDGKRSSVLTQFEITEKRNIDIEEFKGYYKLMSVETHSSPTSIGLLSFTRSYDGDWEMYSAFSYLLLHYTAAFLADLIKTTGEMWGFEFAKEQSEEVVKEYSSRLFKELEVTSAKNP